MESDNEPALTSLTERWSTLRAMKSGSGMTIQNSPFGSWNSYRIVERTIQSVQGVIRTLRSTIQEQWEGELVTHSVWLWIAEQARFLLTRFEVGGDGKTAYERPRRKISEGTKACRPQKESCGRGDEQEVRLRKLMCLREDGVYFGHQEATVRDKSTWCNQSGVWLTRTVRRKTARDRRERSNLELTDAVSWRKNEDDVKMAGERPKGEVVMMDKDCKEKLEMEEHVPVPKRVYKTSEDLEVFKFTARCRWAQCRCSKETARKAPTENRRRRIEEALRSTVKAEAPQRRVEEDQDKAAARGTQLNKKESENKKFEKAKQHIKNDCSDDGVRAKSSKTSMTFCHRREILDDFQGLLMFFSLLVLLL